MLNYISVTTTTQDGTRQELNRRIQEIDLTGYEVSFGALVASEKGYSQTAWITPRRDEK